METTGINFLAVIVAALAYMVLGALWYSPMLFGNAWMRGIGKSKEEVTKDFSPLNYFWGLVTSFLAAYGIARFMLWSGGDGIADGVKIGLVAGICFVLATIGVNDIFEGRPKGLSFINIFYHMFGLVIAGVIIGVW